ncbi:MAG TPA: ATP-binding protein [Sunxiuqinia sp.]|nr:ATP-binding protein [Sunxiuqinia sp.]
MWIERKNTAKIEEAVKKRPVVLLTGIRQAGKSSLLKKLFTDAEYVTLDQVLKAQEAEENPSKFLSHFDKQVIIDEIQYAPSLFRDLKIKIDEERHVKGKWILTGSQQFVLMQKVCESLAGRVTILNLGTLSATELNEAKLLDNKSDLLWKGGFPEVWAENLEAGDFFDDYIQTYLERDLKQIVNVSSLRDFRRFLSLLALRVGQLLNFSEISKEVGVSVNTIKSWVNALEISGLIILLPPYYNNLGKRLIKTQKLYFCDNGLVASLLNIDSLKAFNNSLHVGNLWENFVFTEFLKEGFVAGKNVFFYRDQNGVEIDFVIEKNGKIFLIEAKANERPDRRKLNFRKVTPLFKETVNQIVACTAEEPRMISLKDFVVFNPLYGFSLGTLLSN